MYEFSILYFVPSSIKRPSARSQYLKIKTFHASRYPWGSSGTLPISSNGANNLSPFKEIAMIFLFVPENMWRQSNASFRRDKSVFLKQELVKQKVCN